MHKKQKKRLLILAAVAALCVLAVVITLSYNHVDHSSSMTKEQISEYNTAITLVARSYGYISSNEFVLIDTVSKEMGGNTDITFRVYKQAKDMNFLDYQYLRVKDVPQNFAPEYMGNGTAKLINDSLTSMVISVTYFK